MTEMLTPGRWRGLKTSGTDDSVFTILAFDQRGSYKKMLPAGSTYEQAVEIKQEVVGHLSRYASAVLLDADYGPSAAAMMSKASGLLLSLEESGYTGDSTYRRMEFNPNWTVAKIKQVGASAVKLMPYYHPGSGALAEEIEDVVRQVIEECHRYDIPLFLEPMSYSLDANISKESAEFAATRPEVVRETARRMGALKPDVLKLEFPVDVKYNSDHSQWQSTCEAVSNATDVPWVLLSAGVDFETFEKQTEIACKAGASGFLAGRAIWKECVTMTPEDRHQFLHNTATERIQRLIGVATAHARPWTQFYSAMPLSTGWYASYPV